MKRDNKKPRGSHSRGRSIDGIISSNPRLGVPVVQPGDLRHGEIGRLGSHPPRTEGFHPMRAANASVGELVAAPAKATEETWDEPIVLDESDEPKERKEHKRPKWRRILKRTFLTLLAIAILAGGYFGFKFYQTSRHVLAGGGQAPAVCDGNVPINTLHKEGDSRVNILLLGIGGEGHEGGDLTDTLMLASLDPVNDKLDLLSVPRDLFVKIPGDGSRKINEAYYFGKTNSNSKDLTQQERDGIKVADQVLEQVLGVTIHYNALVDFQAFQDAVNALGGVDANVPKELTAYENFWVEGTNKHYILNVKAGQNHFDGMRALYFARERHNDSDFVRGQRQRLMLAAIKEKALSVGTLTNPVKISNLLNSLGNNVYTDFDSGSIKCLAKQVSEVPNSSIASLDLVTPPHDLLYSSGLAGSTLSPKAGIYDFSQIQNYVRTTLRDSFLAKENSAVAVYNATNIAGVATTQAGLLKTYGYNVTVTDNAPKQLNPPTTTIVDLSGGADKYTKNYLEQRYKQTARSSLPADYGLSVPQGTRFVIILGKDISS